MPFLLGSTDYWPIYILIFYFNPDKPNAPDNIVISEINHSSKSLMVRWDRVSDLYPIFYTVRWTGEDGINNTATIMESSYTIMSCELTYNTSYNISVYAMSAQCGTGPVSDVVTVMTRMLPNTSMF